MADKLSAIDRSRNMASIRSKDMKPELLVRQLAHGLGFRFRLHRKDLSGKPDLVFPKHKAIIFVHGCFWHQHTEPKCLDGRPPKSNSGYWGPKLARNLERDARNKAELERQGWRVLVIWECETKKSEAVAKKIQRLLRPELVRESPLSPAPECLRYDRGCVLSPVEDEGVAHPVI